MEKPRRVWGPGLLAPPDATAERGVSAKPAGGMGVPRPKAIASLMCLWRNRAKVQRLFDSSRRGHARRNCIRVRGFSGIGNLQRGFGVKSWRSGPLPAAAHVNRRLGFDLLGGFGRRNEVARDLTDEIEELLTGSDLGC